MRERDFQAWVLDVARMHGWQCWHVPAPMRKVRSGEWVGAKEAAGLPDLVMIHDDPPRLVFAEVKGTGGKLTPEQQGFLQLIREVSNQADDAQTGHHRVLAGYVFQPGTEPMIEAILKTRVLPAA